MQTLLAAIVVSMALNACSNNDKNSSLIFEELNESLERSVRITERATELELYALNTKKRELAYAVLSVYWHGKADSVHLLSNKIVADVDTVRQRYKDNVTEDIRKDIEELFEKLRTYKIEILKLDSAYVKVFDKDYIAITTKYLKRFNASKEFTNRIISLDKKNIQLALLEVKNDIRSTENDLINFSRDQFGGCVLNYTHISAVVLPSSNHLKSGEELEISAGIGSFSTACEPKCKIGDTIVNVNESGIAVYKSRIMKSIGNYKIPVEIEYTDEKGQRQKFSKIVEYTVDK